MQEVTYLLVAAVDAAAADANSLRSTLLFDLYFKMAKVGTCRRRSAPDNCAQWLGSTASAFGEHMTAVRTFVAEDGRTVG